MDKLLQILKDFIMYDKEFFDEWAARYWRDSHELARRLIRHEKEILCADTDFSHEFLDYLDGNGFELKPYPASSWWTDTENIPVLLVPIYEGKEIIYEEEDEPASPIYIPVQEVTLSYTSMEMDEGPVLECEELYTPRPLWICLHRCLEFLRLVSAGWCRSASLPRPP